MIVINDIGVVGEFSAIVAQYETALADNDVEVMRRLFWESGETVCFDPSGEQHGHDVIDAWRRTRQPLGPREVIRSQVTTSDESCAIATAEFTRDGSTDIGRQM